MTHKGALPDARDALEKSGIDLSEEERSQALAKLDAFIEAEKEAVGLVLKGRLLQDAATRNKEEE